MKHNLDPQCGKQIQTSRTQRNSLRASEPLIAVVRCFGSGSRNFVHLSNEKMYFRFGNLLSWCCPTLLIVTINKTRARRPVVINTFRLKFIQFQCYFVDQRNVCRTNQFFSSALKKLHGSWLRKKEFWLPLCGSWNRWYRLWRTILVLRLRNVMHPPVVRRKALRDAPNGELVLEPHLKNEPLCPVLRISPKGKFSLLNTTTNWLPQKN